MNVKEWYNKALMGLGFRRIDDVGVAAEHLIMSSLEIAPDKRFAAFKQAIEILYKDYRVYKYHGCNRKKLIGLSGDE